MVIILFFPLSFCAANLLADGWRFLSRLVPQKKIFTTLLILPLVAFYTWGAVETRSIINPQTVFTSRADISAIQWIKSNVPSDARFLINATYWQTSIYRGVDGGYWLLPLTGIFTVPPPVAYYWGDLENITVMIDLSKNVSELKTCDDAFWKDVETGMITYIYLKEGVGSLQATGLQPCDGLVPVYSGEGVTVIHVTQMGR